MTVKKDCRITLYIPSGEGRWNSEAAEQPYGVLQFQNYVMTRIVKALDKLLRISGPDDLRAVISRHPTTALLEHIYKNTTGDSRLRRVFTDWLALCYRGIESDNLSVEIVCDMFKRLQLPNDGGSIFRILSSYVVDEDIDRNREEIFLQATHAPLEAEPEILHAW
jgi:hypothetical protein